MFPEDMEELKISYIIGEDVKIYNHFEKQFGSFLQS